MDFIQKSLRIGDIIFLSFSIIMQNKGRNNAIKRIIVLLVILVFVVLYKESIGQEFEGFLTNYYLDQQGLSGQILP